MFTDLCLGLDAMVVMETPTLNNTASKEIPPELSNFLGAMPMYCPSIIPNSLVKHPPTSDQNLFKTLSYTFYQLRLPNKIQDA